MNISELNVMFCDSDHTYFVIETLSFFSEFLLFCLNTIS